MDKPQIPNRLIEAAHSAFKTAKPCNYPDCSCARKAPGEVECEHRGTLYVKYKDDGI